MTAPKATNKQKRDIHVLASALGIADEDRRQDMKETYGVTTSKDLTYSEADEYISHLEERAIASGVWKHPNRNQKLKKYDDIGHRPGMATPGQMRLIEYLWSRVTRYDAPTDQKRALRHFLHNRFKRGDITMIEETMVAKVVHTLEAMYEQKVKDTEVKA